MVKSKEQTTFLIILLIAIFARLTFFGKIPAGINCDEAYAGYESFLLLTYGKDSLGKIFPVYLITGGGGTDALYSYLTMPFIYIFGTYTWAIRIPQVIMGILSCYVFYLLLKTITDKQKALIGFFLISIIPWHIILSRWGFHGNLVATFYLLELYFYCRAFKDIKFIYPCTLCSALALYSYNTSWGFIALSMLFEYIYLLIYNPKQFRHIFLSGLILCILSLPLILLILINMNLINEINTPYFTIPKLPAWRGNEVNFKNINENFQRTLAVLYTQNDNMIWNTLPPYGLFYKFSNIFILIGIWKMCQKIKMALKAKQFSYESVILGIFSIGLVYSCTFPATSSNRINFLFFPLIIMMYYGIIAFFNHKKILLIILAIYGISFICFCHTYYTKYNMLAKENFSIGLKEAIDFAHTKQKENTIINILSNESEASKILFYQKVTPEYDKTDSAEIKPQLKQYRFFNAYDNITFNDDEIYIAPSYLEYFFTQMRHTHYLKYKIFENYIVIYNLKQH